MPDGLPLVAPAANGAAGRYPATEYTPFRDTMIGPGGPFSRVHYFKNAPLRRSVYDATNTIRDAIKPMSVHDLAGYKERTGAWPGSPGHEYQAGSAEELANRVHGVNPRAALYRASRSEGYPLTTPNVAKRLTAERWSGGPGTMPRLEFGDRSEYAHLHDVVTIARPSLLQHMDRDAQLSHEFEHAMQRPPNPHALLADRTRDPSGTAAEFAASIGDFPFQAEAHKRYTGKPLNYDVPLAADYAPNADWMARMAKQHGVFGAKRTVTENLATPSGLAWTKMLQSRQPPTQQQTATLKPSPPLGPPPSMLKSSAWISDLVKQIVTSNRADFAN
jgi:hypothetical protein